MIVLHNWIPQRLFLSDTAVSGDYTGAPPLCFCAVTTVWILTPTSILLHTGASMGVPYSPLLVAPLVSLKSLTMSELSAFGSDIDFLLCSVEEGLGDLLWFLKLLGGELVWKDDIGNQDCWIRPEIEAGTGGLIMLACTYLGIDLNLRLSHPAPVTHFSVQPPSRVWQILPHRI